MQNNYLGIDVGTKRIGIAAGDSQTGIAYPLTTLDVGDDVFQRIAQLASEHGVKAIIVGYPRNQSGEPTAQTEVATQAADKLRSLGLECVLQDESLTSVLAEERLASSRRPYSKADIDMHAACLILQDYLEALRHA